MSEINPTQDIFSAAGIRTAADAPVREEASQQADFLLLMTEQIKHQNPLNPLEGKDFLAQLAQFTTVEELTKLNKGFEDLSSSVVSDQSLQAAALIGKSATVAAGSGLLSGDRALAGSVDLPLPASDLTVNYYDQVGQLVHSQGLGSRPSGPVDFSWNGIDAGGNRLAEGIYRIEALANMGQGTEALSTQMDARIESVSLGASGGGIKVNLEGVGQVALSEIRLLKDGAE